MKTWRGLIIGLLALTGVAGVDSDAQSPVAVADEEVSARHDPADPLLPAKLQWDELNDAKLILGQSYSCNRRVRILQHMRFNRRFERRMLWIAERFRSEFGQEVIEHGHDFVGVGRCVQHSNSTMPAGNSAFAQQLRRTEQWLAMTSAERSEP